MPAEAVRKFILLSRDHGQAKAGQPYGVPFSVPGEVWPWITRQIGAFARLLDQRCDWDSKPPQERGQLALQLVLESCLAPQLDETPPGERGAPATERRELELRVTLDFTGGEIELAWGGLAARTKPLATGRIRCTGYNELTWECAGEGAPEIARSTHRRNAVRAQGSHGCFLAGAVRDANGESAGIGRSVS